MRIFLDPGHGGSKRGCERAGLIEKDLAMSIARDLEAFCRQWPHLEIVKSRDNDETRAYSRRAEQAKNWKADLVLCLHIDARQTADGEDDTKATGAQCYTMDGDQVSFEVGKKIMQAMAAGLEPTRGLPIATHPKPHWTRRAHSILRLYSPLPAVLIEWGFMTNSYDRAALTDLSNRPAMSVAALAGITRLMQIRDKQPRG